MDSPILPNTGRAYDPNVAQDHTDLAFQSSAKLPEHTRKDPRYDAALLMKKPAWYGCPHCKSVDRWRLLVESSPQGDGLVQFICGACKASAPVMALGQVQMTSHVASSLHIPEPKGLQSFSYDMDLER